jgi:hypothetical protein
MASRWWFKHDYRARSDTKLLELEFEFGMHEGYSLWFRMLEIMGEYGGKLSIAKLPLYASLIRIDLELFKRFLDFCISIELLHESDGFIVSKRFLQDYDAGNAISKTNSANANSRWQKEKSCDGNATADATASETPMPVTMQDTKQAAMQATETPKPKKPKAPDITGEIVSHWNSMANQNSQCARPSGHQHHNYPSWRTGYLWCHKWR